MCSNVMHSQYLGSIWGEGGGCMLHAGKYYTMFKCAIVVQLVVYVYVDILYLTVLQEPVFACFCDRVL
jgi:hypothetical protein